MKNLKKISRFSTVIIFGLSLLFSACDQEENNSVTLYEAGKLDAQASSTDIKFGESITYTDLSTKVHTRQWVFPGGTPGTSTDPTVTVHYPTGGSYTATLNIVFVDNQKAQHIFDIEVEPDPNNQIPEYDFGVTYGLYTEHEDITPGAHQVQLASLGNVTGAHISEGTFEGQQAYKFMHNGNDTWVQGGLQTASGVVNFTPFQDGYYHIGLKSECMADIFLRIRDEATNRVEIKFTAAGEEYGFKRDGFWHLVSIPMADIRAKQITTVNFSRIKDFTVLRSVDGDGPTRYDNYVFYVDHVFLSEKMEAK